MTPAFQITYSGRARDTAVSLNGERLTDAQRVVITLEADRSVVELTRCGLGYEKTERYFDPHIEMVKPDET